MRVVPPVRSRLPTLTWALAGIVPLFAVSMVACSGEPAPDPAQTYSATIRRTSYGIPHIQAADLPSLGFGEGYAFASDHLCSLADQVIYVRGERAKYFGRGEDDRHFASDVTAKALRVRRARRGGAAAAPAELREWMEGYAAGYNLYLRETGAAQLERLVRGPAVGAGDQRRRRGRLSPHGRADGAAFHRDDRRRAPPEPGSEIPSATGGSAAARLDQTQSVLTEELDADLASNGWAIGSERSESGGGMLIANPHYPWEGSNRFWEKHLTIPGRLDGYGVSLLGTPGVSIGFNANVAWTHTVSAGQRHTLYRLRLAEDDPTVLPLRRRTPADAQGDRRGRGAR